jgi:spore germination protein KC
MIERLVTKVLLCLLILLTLPGCGSKRELNELSIVSGIGIDKANVPGDVLLTAQIVKPGEMKKPSKEGVNDEGKAFWNLTSSSDTVFNVIREFTHETDNRLYLAHTQAIIFGKDIAGDGVQKYLDFFMRSHETRPTVAILVSNSTAGEALNVNPQIEKLPAIKMAKLAKVQERLTAHAMSVNMQDFTNRLLSKTTSPIAPIVTVADNNGKKILHVEGMAVFKADKMVGSIDSIETRGLLWVLGKVKSGAIDIDLPNGKATLEVTKAESKVTLEINGGKVYFNIRIKEESVLASQTSPDNLATITNIPLLEKHQNEVIKTEILSVVKKAKEQNTDIFGFGDMMYKKYGAKWKSMENNWDNIFPYIEVQIEAETKIKAAGLIIKPAVPKKEE